MRLVEERECKVIVISNEDKLKEKGKEKLDAAREKLFDLEFLFSPSAAEAVSAIAANEKDRKRLNPVFEALDLNNLRVITKVNAAALLNNKARPAKTEARLNLRQGQAALRCHSRVSGC